MGGKLSTERAIPTVHGEALMGGKPSTVRPLYRRLPVELRVGVPQLGIVIGCPPAPFGIGLNNSRELRSVSSLAMYASIAVNVALFLTSSMISLSYESRCVCHVLLL